MKIWPWILGGGVGWLLWSKRASAQTSPAVSTKSTFVWTFRTNDLARVTSGFQTQKAEINTAVSGCLLNGRLVGWSSRPTGEGDFFIDVVFEHDGAPVPEEKKKTVSQCIDKGL